MLGAAWLDILNLRLKTLRRQTKAFGGLQVILSGDFFQLPPIGKGQAAAYAFMAEAWQELSLQACYLSEQHRQTDDGLRRLLQAMRSADVNLKDLGVLLDRQVTPKRDITVLLTHNRDVDRVNHERLNRLSGDLRIYEMAMSGHREALIELQHSVVAPQRLYLKSGAKVMFTANDLSLGYANGSIGSVIGFNHGFPVVAIDSSGLKLRVEPKQWNMTIDEHTIAKISQLPLRLAWAVTIHKCQGMSLDAAEVDLSRSFTYGMGYVALSRVKSLNGLYLRGFNSRSLEMDPAVKQFDQKIKKLSGKIDSVMPVKLNDPNNSLANVLYRAGASRQLIKLSTGLSEEELKKILK